MRTSSLFLLALVLVLSAFWGTSRGDDGDEFEMGDEPIVGGDGAVEDEKEESSKEAYIPIDFEPPKVTGSYHFVDAFLSRDGIGKRWHKSTAKKDDVDEAIAKYNGEWEIEEPQKVAIRGDFGLVAKSKARLHAIAAKFDRPFNFQQNKALVVQYEVKFQEGQDCGGGYMKLLTAGAEKNLREFRDKTPYTIMFGPDKCGLTSKVHFILRYINPKNGSDSEHHAKQSTKSLSEYFDSQKTHLYTLIIKEDNEFKVLVDNSEIMSGNLLKDLDPPIQPPKMIDDPNETKPADWDDQEKIVDPDAKKPDDWDEDAPKEIVDENAKMPNDWLEEEEEMIGDPTAKKPDDWDNDMDGEWQAPSIKNPKCEGISGCGKWTAPMIANPAYKGKWKAPKIANPNYKGKWAPQQIENPHFFEPNPFAQLSAISAIGFELWTMSADILFDNLIITDQPSVAKQFAEDTFAVKTRQEAAFRSATAAGDGGVFANVMAATEERPWLWAVFVIALLVPVVLVAIFCFGRKSTPSSKSAAARKKDDDAAGDDDDVPDLVNDEDEEEEEVEKSPRGKNASGDHRHNAKGKKVTKDDLEGDDDDDNEAAAGHSSANEESSPKASPATRRLRQRRQD